MPQFKIVADIDEEYNILLSGDVYKTYFKFILKIFNSGKLKCKKRYKCDPVLLNIIALYFLYTKNKAIFIEYRNV